MQEVSEAQVNEAVKSLKDAQAELPETGSFTNALEMVASIVDVLKDCWNTASGVEAQQKLKTISESELDSTKLEQALASLKELEISVSMIEESSTGEATQFS